MTRRLIEKINIGDEYKDISVWPKANTLPLDDTDRDLYLRREKAIILYLKDNCNLKDIQNQTGIAPYTIRRLIKRCFMLDNYGQIWGFRALIPQKHVMNYNRKKSTSLDKTNSPKSFQGAFSQLLKEYPEIDELITNLYLKKDKKMKDMPSKSPTDIHIKFINACRDIGIKSSEYPLNTYDLARRSLYRYLKYIHNTHFEVASGRYGEEVQRNAVLSYNNQATSPLPIRPFEQVQFDGHKIDAKFVMKMKTPTGDEEYYELSRLWILTILDVATRTVLGYRLCLNSEYSAEDVLQCVRNAVVPKRLMEFTIPGLKYPEKIGFHSSYIKETEWAVWNELYFDNAKANLANIVRPRLTQTIKCAVNAGPVKVPKRRVLIERFFGILEEYGYHKLPSTTGSSITDKRNENSSEKAKKYFITEEHLAEITEALIIFYNLCPHSSLDYKSPLECMEHRIRDRRMEPRYLEEEDRNNLSILRLSTQRVVLGNIKKGKRPYINYEGVRYYNDILSRTPSLIGKKLELLVNIEDLRSIKAYLSDGSEIGILRASGKWGTSPHSLKTRKEINKLKAKRLIYFTSNENPIDVYNEFLVKNIGDKNKRNKLANLNRSKKEMEKDIQNSVANEDDHMISETQSESKCIKKINSIKKSNSNITKDNKEDLNKYRDLFKTFTY